MDMIKEEEIKEWNCVYPLYFDKGRSLAEGRRVPQALAIERPTTLHVTLALEYLGGFEFALEAGKRHPRDPLTFGRIRVKKGDSCTNVLSLLVKIAGAIPKVIEKIPKDPVATKSASNSTPKKEPLISVETAAGVSMVPRTKKKIRKQK